MATGDNQCYDSGTNSDENALVLPCFAFCSARCALFILFCPVQNFDDVKTLFMQSDGGLTPVASFRGSRAILSGPAGGVVGYAATSYGDGDAGGRGEEKPAVIGFDMGGTSTGGRAVSVVISRKRVRVRVRVCMCFILFFSTVSAGTRVPCSFSCFRAWGF